MEKFKSLHIIAQWDSNVPYVDFHLFPHRYSDSVVCVHVILYLKPMDSFW